MKYISQDLHGNFWNILTMIPIVRGMNFPQMPNGFILMVIGMLMQKIMSMTILVFGMMIQMNSGTGIWEPSLPGLYYVQNACSATEKGIAELINFKSIRDGFGAKAPKNFGHKNKHWEVVGAKPILL